MRNNDKEERSPLITAQTPASFPSPSSTSPIQHQGQDEERYHPWWLILIFPLKLGAPKLTHQQWSTLLLVGSAGLFRSYDTIIMTLSIAQIQRDLSISDHEISFVTSIIQIGALCSFAVAVLADHFGRRIALLATIGPFTLLTFFTAFSRSALAFAVLQFFSRLFCQAEFLLAQVVITEEFDADNRGWGIGALGALGGIGSGLALVAFGFAGEHSNGWRIMYLASVFPLSILLYARRNLKETKRFETLHSHLSPNEQRHSLANILHPVKAMITEYPKRFFACLATGFGLAFSGAPASFFTFKYMQEVHSYTPQEISLLGVLGGCIAIFSYMLAGLASDRYGRKNLIIAMLLMATVSNVLFFEAPTNYRWAIPILWVIKVSDTMAISVLFGTFSSELFPTAFRSTARGAVMAAVVLGESAGLLVEGEMRNHMLSQSHWKAIAQLSGLQLVVLPVIWLALPETSHLDLERIAPDDAVPELSAKTTQ